MKKILPAALVVLLLLAGLALLLYPCVSNFVAVHNQSVAIQEYTRSLAQMTAEQTEEERQRAQEYNDLLVSCESYIPFDLDSCELLSENYEAIRNQCDGVFGYIEIPAIDVSLPIYLGTSDAILKRGVGHVEMTAFPIGGEGNHAVLTGHSSLPMAKLFTDLDKLEIGDLFYIHVLGETLAYEADQMLVVLPEDTEALAPEKGEDYLTLITCFPRAVNSHRLLVRGTRIPCVADEVGPEATGGFSISFILAIILFIIGMIAIIYLPIVRRRSA